MMRKRQIFARNLRSLCETRSSISAVCRDLDINRQQFGKYLTGAILPSANNMRIICNYFGIDINDIFVDDVLAMASPPSTSFERMRDRITSFHSQTSRVRNRTQDFAPANGYYMAYNLSFAAGTVRTGMFVMCNITRLLCNDGLIAYRRKHIPRGNFRFENFARDYYGQGVISNYGLYIRYADCTGKDSFGALILKKMNVPAHDLAGVNIAVAGTREGEPAAARIYLRYVGEQPNLRKLKGEAGLWEESETGAEMGEIFTFLKQPINPKDLTLRAF